MAVVPGLIKLLGKSLRPMWKSSGFGSPASCPLPGICRALSSFHAHKIIKGQCHEIFDFWFFSLISFPQAPEYTNQQSAISNRRGAGVTATCVSSNIWAKSISADAVPAAVAATGVGLRGGGGTGAVVSSSGSPTLHKTIFNSCDFITLFATVLLKKNS